MMEAQHLTQALRGKWYRRYGVAFCPAHRNTRTPALRLANGNDGRLLIRCSVGCTFLEVLDGLRRLGLVEGRGRLPMPDPAETARYRAAEEAEAAKREKQAVAVWREAVPISSTVAEAYLRSRGITCGLPDTIRFHPACWHPTARRIPAMVALVEGCDRLAVHRTYLRKDGSGKAAADPDRAMLGAVAGGAVRLSEGTGPLTVAEGLETALSLASGLLAGPATVWAALSTSGMQSLRLPPGAGRLIVATDGEMAGRAAGHALAERATALGWAVSLLPAPDRSDWNDVLCGKAVAP